MPNAFVFKGSSSGQRNPGGLSVIVDGTRDKYKSIGIYDQNDNLLEDLSYTPNVPEPGVQGDPATKFYSTKSGASFGKNIKTRVTYADGRTEDYAIDDGAGYYRGTIGDPNSLQAMAAPSGGGGGSSGVPKGFQPGNIGYGSFPAYLGGEFPNPNLTDNAPYTFTDPIKFAESFGGFNRDEIRKNFDLAKDLSLDTLDTELESLQSFVPAASALKRNQTSLDNAFNQQQRTQQIDSTLPGVRSDLEAQAARSRDYASGKIPDAVANQAFELGIRSDAADRAAAGGFGASSSVARKASDLLSATERVKLSQYGDQLLSSNINQKANILLAPTEYSNAGSQINVMPSVSPSQLISNNLNQLNSNTLINPTTGLQSVTQQNQFMTQQQQHVNDINAATQNQFGLAQFGYDVSYANGVAGAAQLNTNTEVAFQQQALAQQIAQNAISNAQGAQQTGAITSAITAFLTQIPSIINAVLGGGSSNAGAPSGNSDVNTPTGDFSSGSTPDFSTGGGYTDNTSSGAGSTPDFGVSDSSSGPSFGSDGNIADNFETDTGLSLYAGSPNTAQYANSVGNSTLRSAGISQAPIAGTQPIGVNQQGQPQYASSSLLRSTDSSMGKQSTQAVRSTVAPMLNLSSEENAQFDKIANAASDVSVAAQLTAQYQAGDKKGFVNTLLQSVGQPVIKDLVDNPDNKAGVGAAFSAYKLFNNWGKMSPAQKSLGIASTGIQAYQFADGTNLATHEIIKATKDSAGKIISPGLTVGQGLNLLSAGYNTYSMVKNWDQLTGLQKIAAGTGDAAQLAGLAKNFGLLGSGTSGAEVAVSGAQLSSAGWSTASQFGPGAIIGEAGKQLPAGFVSVGQQGSQVIAAPAGSATVAQESTSAASGSVLGTAAGVASVAAGAYQVYKGWGSGGKSGALNGAIGGSAMAAGLVTLGATNPYILGGMVAYSALGGKYETGTGGSRVANASVAANPLVAANPALLATKFGKDLIKPFTSGKSKEQRARDSVRGYFKEGGLIDENNKINNADGSSIDVGVDGHGGQHTVRDPSKLTEHDKNLKKLSAYDVDYTNDMDYTAALGGIALARLSGGGKGDSIDQIGGQIGNASLGSVGFGKDMTEANFKQVMGNLRAQYAKAGITSKADAFQLANQGFAEGRFNETDTRSIQLAANMIFDTDYKTAMSLMAGRFAGVKTAQDLKNAQQPKQEAAPIQQTFKTAALTKEQVRAKNQQQFRVAPMQGAVA